MGDVDGGGTTSPVMPNSSGGESSQDELESPEHENLLMGDEPEHGRNNLLQGIPLDQQVHHDPFQLPLVGAGALGGPPVLPMGGAAGAMQGKLTCGINLEQKTKQIYIRCRRYAGYGWWAGSRAAWPCDGSCPKVPIFLHNWIIGEGNTRNFLNQIVFSSGPLEVQEGATIPIRPHRLHQGFAQ